MVHIISLLLYTMALQNEYPKNMQRIQAMIFESTSANIKPEEQQVLLNEAKQLFDVLTEEDILSYKKTGHYAILYVAVQQSFHNIEILKLMWNHPIFKPYWNSVDYHNWQGNKLTILEELKNYMNNPFYLSGNPAARKWINENIF